MLWSTENKAKISVKFKRKLKKLTMQINHLKMLVEKDYEYVIEFRKCLNLFNFSVCENM